MVEKKYYILISIVLAIALFVGIGLILAYIIRYKTSPVFGYGGGVCAFIGVFGLIATWIIYNRMKDKEENSYMDTNTTNEENKQVTETEMETKMYTTSGDSEQYA